MHEAISVPLPTEDDLVKLGSRRACMIAGVRWAVLVLQERQRHEEHNAERFTETEGPLERAQSVQDVAEMICELIDPPIVHG